QEKMYGPVLYQAFRELKRTFDPQGIFNPGKIVDAPPLSANLRYGPTYITPDVPTTFDFSADGGMTRLAELCAGVGECRKKRGGVLGNIAALSPWGSRLAPQSNWLARSRLVRWLNEKLLRIDRRRLPPAFARRTLRQLFTPMQREGTQVLLFPDTFTNYYEPAIGLAAVELLQRAQCAVTLGPRDLRCCGRPLISSGLLDQAVNH